jgi:hypothetical protein
MGALDWPPNIDPALVSRCHLAAGEARIARGARLTSARSSSRIQRWPETDASITVTGSVWNRALLGASRSGRGAAAQRRRHAGEVGSSLRHEQGGGHNAIGVEGMARRPGSTICSQMGRLRGPGGKLRPSAERRLGGGAALSKPILLGSGHFWLSVYFDLLERPNPARSR